MHDLEDYSYTIMIMNTMQRSKEVYTLFSNLNISEEGTYHFMGLNGEQK